MKRDDALWKGLIEDLFDDFLRFYFPESVDLFDFNRKFVFLDKELEQLFPQSQDDFNPNYVDKLVKVFTKKGKEEWILIHIEVQGSRDKNFAKRMFTYRYRILDKYDKPITSLAILADKYKSYKPNVYRYELMRNELYYKFNIYKVLDANEKELKQSDNPFAVVVRVVQTALKKDKLSDNQLFDLKLELVKELLKKNFTKEKIRNLLQFLKLYIRFDNQELINKFETELSIIQNQKTTMGLEEFVLDRERRVGREEGMSIKEIEEKTNFTKNLLTQTDFDDEKIASLVGVEVDFVRQVKASL